MRRVAFRGSVNPRAIAVPVPVPVLVPVPVPVPVPDCRYPVSVPVPVPTVDTRRLVVRQSDATPATRVVGAVHSCRRLSTAGTVPR